MRGLAEGALVAIIIAIASGIVLGGVAGTLVLKGKQKLNIAACKADVEAAALTAQLAQVNSCYTKPIGALDFSGNELTYAEEVSKQVSELLYECRFQFGEAPHLPWKGSWLSTEPICFVCSTFSLPEKAPPGLKGQKLGVSTSKLADWLKSHKTATGKTTYYDYVIQSIPFKDPDYFMISEMRISSLSKLKEFLLLTGGKAAVIDNPKVFEHGKEYAVIHFGWAQYRHAQAPPVSLFSGTAKTLQDEAELGEYSSVFIMPIEKLSTACSITFTRYPE